MSLNITVKVSTVGFMVKVEILFYILPYKYRFLPLQKKFQDKKTVEFQHNNYSITI